MKLQQEDCFHQQISHEKIGEGRENFSHQDHNHGMAPIQNSKSDYLRFMNFQRYYVFHSVQKDSFDQRPLKIQQLERLAKLITFLHVQYKSNILSLNDIKGIWPIISFIFPNRTGLFVNQFYSMLIEQKLDLRIYENLLERKQVQKFTNQQKQKDWYKDVEFNKSLGILIKQAKSFNGEEQDRISSQFIHVRSVLENQQQYQPFISLLNKQIDNFEYLAPKRKVNILDRIEELKDIGKNSLFEQDEEQYVLSEPDTLVADICETFEEKEYNFIKRKLSEKLYFDEETETFAYQPTTAKKLSNKDEHIVHEQQSNQLSNCKRKLDFSLQNDQIEQKTISIKRQLRKRPRIQNHLNHLTKMINHQRQINKKNEQRVKNHKKVKNVKRMKKRQNLELEKHIRKIYFDQNVIIRRRQKRNISPSNKRSSKQKSMHKNIYEMNQFQDWNQRYVEEESVNESQYFSNMEIEQSDQQFSISSKNKRRQKKSGEKRENKNRRVISYKNDLGLSKQVKRRVSGTKRKQIQNDFVVPDNYQDYKNGQDSKTKQKLPRKPKNQYNFIDQIPFEQRNHQKKHHKKPKQIISNKKRLSFQKKDQSFVRLRKQAEKEKQSQFSQNQSHYVNYDQFIENSETINFERNERKDNIEKNKNKHEIQHKKRYNQKYMHLIGNNNKKPTDKKQTEKQKQHTLHNYFVPVTQNYQHQKFEPLERMQIRRLNIFEFEQNHRATERLMIIQNEQMTPYQKMRKQLCHYEYFNEMKLSFGVIEFIEYLQSLQNEREIFSEIKKLVTQYLSKSFQPDFSYHGVERQKYQTNRSNHFKLILIERKILGFYFLIKKEEYLVINQNDAPKKYTPFYLSYIKPLMQHYFYKITLDMSVEIINSLFTSQGDEDYSLLNKVSLPFMMLVYDIRSISSQQKFKQINGFCKSVYEDIYQNLTEQASLISLQIMLDLNKSENVVKNQTKQKINKLLNDQIAFSYINLPRLTIKLMNKNLRVSLSPIDMLYSSLIASALFQISLYEQILRIFMTMSPQHFDSNKLRQLRQGNYEKSAYFITFQMTTKTILTLNFQDKGAQQIRNISNLINELFCKINFEFQHNVFLLVESKYFTILLRSFRQCSSNTSQSSNKKLIVMKEETLNFLKQMLNRCLIKFIEKEEQKSFATILNVVLIQRYGELKSIFPINYKGQPFIQVDLYFQIIDIFIKFKKFKQSPNLHRPYLLKQICQVVKENSMAVAKENKMMIFAGRNRTSEMFQKMFNLAMTGYKSQIKGSKLWQINDQILREKNLTLNQKKTPLIYDYWQVIKDLIKAIFQKFKQFPTLIKQDENGNKSFLSQIDQQKYENYTNLFNYMLGEMSGDIIDFRNYDVESIDKKCNEGNCLNYSLQHILINVLSLVGDYNFFIDVDFLQVENEAVVNFFLSPTKVINNLFRLTMVQQEINIRQNQNDKEEQQDLLFQLQMKRPDNKKEIFIKMLEILGEKLNFEKIQISNNGFWYVRNNGHIKKLSVISLIQLMKPLLAVQKATQNRQNQKQKPFGLQLGKPTISLFQEFIKKFQFISWSQSFMQNNSAVIIKEPHERQLESLKISFDFFEAIAKFLAEIQTNKVISDVQKQKNTKNKELLSDQLLRRIRSQYQSSKDFLMNFVTGVILKNMLWQNEREQKDKAFLSMIQFWCKLYTTLFPSSYLFQKPSASLLSTVIQDNNNNQTIGVAEFNLFLYIGFRRMIQTKSQNQNKLKVNKNLFAKQDRKRNGMSVFGLFLECFLSLFKQNYLNATDQRAKNLFNQLFTHLCDHLYCYMKQLLMHVLKLKQEHDIQKQIIGQNFTRLFGMVLKWPSMLPNVLKKMRIEFQTFLNHLHLQDLNNNKNKNSGIANVNNNQRTSTQMGANLGTKTLLQGLIITPTFNAGNNKIYQDSNNSNIQSIILIVDALRSLGILSANVFQVKQTVPKSVFLLLMKKIIEQENQVGNRDDGYQNNDAMFNNNINSNISLNKINGIEALPNGLRHLMIGGSEGSGINQILENKYQSKPMIGLLKLFFEALQINFTRQQVQNDENNKQRFQRSFNEGKQLIKRLLQSFIRFLAYRPQHRILHQHLERQQLTSSSNPTQTKLFYHEKFYQQEMKIHEIGKKLVKDYRERILLTVCWIIRDSCHYRAVIENTVWENVCCIEQFLAQRKQEQVLVFSQKNEIGNNLLNQSDTDKISCVEEIIGELMVGRESDFYLVSRMLRSRIEKVMDAKIIDLNNNSSTQQQQQRLYQLRLRKCQHKLQLLLNAANRAIFFINAGIINSGDQRNNGCNDGVLELISERRQMIVQLLGVVRECCEEWGEGLNDQSHSLTLRDFYERRKSQQQADNNNNASDLNNNRTIQQHQFTNTQMKMQIEYPTQDRLS